MPKVSRTYRIEQETADRISDISEFEGKTATEVVEAAIRAYSSEEYAGNTAKQADSTDSPALAALISSQSVSCAPLRLNHSPRSPLKVRESRTISTDSVFLFTPL